MKHINLQQTLHGYSSGHRLLASSADLDMEDQRALLRMSDLSGPRMVDGFQEYLSAYPLPSGRYYAFAKTWYADEMERPGCVWTHTLLISPQQLPLLKQLNVLSQLFTRPNSKRPGRDSSYSRALVDVSLETVLYRSPSPYAIAKEVLGQLYGTNYPAVFPATSGMEFADLAMYIWSQQWPQLRFRFSFCTGSLSSAGTEPQPLDLQFSPIRLLHGYSQHPRSQTDQEDGWLFEALTDLPTYEGTDFRQFLWRWGHDLISRQDFHVIGQSYVATRRQDVRAALTVVGRYYPSPAEGRSLKQLFAVERAQEIRSVLSGIFALKLGSAFSPDDLGLPKMVAELFRQKARDEISDLLQQAVATPSGGSVTTTFVRLVATEISSEHFEMLSDLSIDVLRKVLEAAPELAYLPKFWDIDLSPQEKASLFRACAKGRGWKKDRALLSVLDSGNYQTASFLIDELGLPEVEAVLAWLPSHPEESWKLVKSEWITVFARYHSSVEKWFTERKEMSPAEIILLAQVADPSKGVLDSLPLKKLTYIANTGKQYLDQRHELLLLLFSLALRKNETKAFDLAFTMFIKLHQLLADEQLNSQAWERLRKLLPPSDPNRPWDECDRLRRLFLHSHLEHVWPAERLWDQLRKNEELFWYVMATAERDSKSRDVFEPLLKNSSIEATRKQRQALNRLG